ncbi:MAG: Lrp/AsnC family transcriptional regulator [Pseudomonadota bacterium]
MTSIDASNERILRELERDGRLSNVELARRVGLSPSACLRRVQDLERSGVIKRYRAVVDHAQLGTSLTVFVMVGLSAHLKKDARAFERAMEASPEVRECHNVTGDVEYLLRVEVTDLAAYKNFHANVLGERSEVNRITSYVCLGSPKDERG